MSVDTYTKVLASHASRTVVTQEMTDRSSDQFPLPVFMLEAREKDGSRGYRQTTRGLIGSSAVLRPGVVVTAHVGIYLYLGDYTRIYEL